ncbi:MAG: class I SAM-dependent methyltransferase [Pseudobdellovibrionaceae bacterium]
MEQTKYRSSYFNDIGLRLAQKLFGLEYLHYGFFEKAPKTLAGLPAAQEEYVQKVLAQIPTEGVTKVLDVGCGAGGVAKQLVSRGYDVTCVDPDPFMLNKTYEATGGKIQRFQGLYEQVTEVPTDAFDMVLMSESCQYVPFTLGFTQHKKHLRLGGHVLIADFFKVRDLDYPYLSKSGHNLNEFLAEAKRQGFELVKDIDITQETAPTMDIYQDILSNRAFPVAEALFEYVERKFPAVYKILRFFVGKKALFLKQKYSAQDALTFKKYKSYRIFLFKKVQA